MTDIDWSKAPEGTTGAMVAQWNHPRGLGHVEFLSPNSLTRASYSEGPHSWLYVPRPTEWNGEGLPPVGTACEALVDPSGNYAEVLVVAHDEGEAVFRFTSGPIQGQYRASEQKIHHGFWIFRTAEQIAEEERSNAIGEMLKCFGSKADVPWDFCICAALYDAGYRKVTS